MAKRDARPHTILITGATDGIGLVLAKDYASRGHKVLATGRRMLRNDHDFFGSTNISYVRADQAAPQQAAQNIAKAMVQFGWTGLDLAILNAGIGWTGDPVEEAPEDISAQVTVNLASTIIITQAVSPWLKAAGGKLAIVGSTAVKGNRNFATYAATKSALDSFCRSLREEWHGKADVAMIHPGPVRTQMHSKAGLNVGVMRMLFASPRRASRSIQFSIRKGDRRRALTRTFAWRSLLSRRKDGHL